MASIRRTGRGCDAGIRGRKRIISLRSFIYLISRDSTVRMEVSGLFAAKRLPTKAEARPPGRAARRTEGALRSDTDLARRESVRHKRKEMMKELKAA